MSHHSGSTPQLDPQVPYFSEAAVRKVLRYDDLIPAMERALIDFSTGKVLQPVRGILPVEQYHGFFGIMPAVYGDIMGAKLVTLFPDNGDIGLPTHQGIIVLLRATTGEPLACSRWTADHGNAHGRGYCGRYQAAGRPGTPVFWRYSAAVCRLAHIGRPCDWFGNFLRFASGAAIPRTPKALAGGDRRDIATSAEEAVRGGRCRGDGRQRIRSGLVRTLAETGSAGECCGRGWSHKRELDDAAMQGACRR